MLVCFFFVDISVLYKPWILPHFQLLPKSQSVYHLGWEKEDENETGEVNDGKYPERMFKSAGLGTSYYVVIWQLCGEYFDMFFFSCFLSLLPEPLVIIITSLPLLSLLLWRLPEFAVPGDGPHRTVSIACVVSLKTHRGRCRVGGSKR